MASSREDDKPHYLSLPSTGIPPSYLCYQLPKILNKLPIMRGLCSSQCFVGVDMFRTRHERRCRWKYWHRFAHTIILSAPFRDDLHEDIAITTDRDSKAGKSSSFHLVGMDVMNRRSIFSKPRRLLTSAVYNDFMLLIYSSKRASAPIKSPGWAVCKMTCLVTMSVIKWTSTLLTVRWKPVITEAFR